MVRAFLVLLVAFYCDECRAQIAPVTECGESAGYSYVFEGGFVSSSDAGFRPDGMTGGAIILNRTGEKYSLLVRDTVAFYSVVDNGGSIFQVPTDADKLLLVVVYRKSVETFLFVLDDFGMGSLAWTSSRGAGAVIRSSLFFAECKARQ